MSKVEAGLELVRRFYTAFADKDWATMSECYTEDAKFSDPVFPNLTGAEPGHMWHYLVHASKGELDVTFTDPVAVEGSDEWDVTSTWTAKYKVDGRDVVNVITASFKLNDDGSRIKEHRDVFDFYKWTRMALGLTGVLLGWTPFVQNKIRATSARRLTRFIAKQGDAPQDTPAADQD